MTGKAIPNLPSHDLDATTELLARIGFAETHRYDGYRIYERGPMELHYYDAADRHDPFTTAGQLYLRVDDVDALYAEAVAAGFEIWDHADPGAELADRWNGGRSIARITELEDKPWGLREFALADTDNNLLRIGQPLSG